MRGKLLIATLAIVATSFVSAPSGAVVLYDNLSASSDGSDSVGGSGPIYDSFSTGAAPLSFTHLSLMLGGQGGSVNVGLYANQVPIGGPFAGSSIPNGLIYNIGTASSLPAGPSVVDFSIPYIALAANTRYWIGLSSGDATALWFYSFDFSGTGVGSEFFFNSVVGVLPNNPDGGYQMLVEASPTPVPAALPLFASGGGVLGFLAWRRKRKAQAEVAAAAA